MTFHRPGHVRVDVNHATLAIEHNAPCVIDGIPGVAIKQKAQLAHQGIAGTTTIAATESFNQIVKGKVQVLNTGSGVAAAARGTLIYIIAASNLLTTVSAGNVAFGRIIEKAGERGTPTGLCRIDLDMKV